jgi:hypothetical protein
MLQVKINNVFHEEIDQAVKTQNVEERIADDLEVKLDVSVAGVRVEWGNKNTPIFLYLEGDIRSNKLTRIARIVVERFSKYAPEVKDDTAVNSENILLSGVDEPRT